MDNFDKILIFDYGSQYTQLIARRVRELNVYSEICRHDISIEELNEKSPKAIILSGGPMSVYDENAYSLYENIYDLNIPILGICYGFQILCQLLGGKISFGKKREFGKTNLQIVEKSPLFSTDSEKPKSNSYLVSTLLFKLPNQ